MHLYLLSLQFQTGFSRYISNFFPSWPVLLMHQDKHIHTSSEAEANTSPLLLFCFLYCSHSIHSQATHYCKLWVTYHCKLWLTIRAQLAVVFGLTDLRHKCWSTEQWSQEEKAAELQYFLLGTEELFVLGLIHLWLPSTDGFPPFWELSSSRCSLAC